MSFQGKPSAPNKVPFWDGTQWTLSDGGGGGVPPLTKTAYVDAATAAPSRDGSIGKPFQTLQEAIDANFVADVDNFINLLVAPGTYTDATLLTTGGNTIAYLSIASTVPGGGLLAISNPTAGVVINGAITVVGSEGDGRVLLQDAYVPVQPIVTTSLALIRAGVETQTVAGVVDLYDTSSFVADPLNPTTINLQNMGHENQYTDADPVPTNANPFPPNYRFQGLHEVTFSLTVFIPATTGTMDLTVEWLNIITGAATQQVISGFDMTTIGVTSVTVPLYLNASPVTYSIVYTGESGNFTYYLSTAIKRLYPII